MARQTYNPIRALFDVKPVKAGAVDFAKVEGTSQTINLRKKQADPSIEPILAYVVDSKKNVHTIGSARVHPQIPKDFHALIRNEIRNPDIELASLGIKVLKNAKTYQTPRFNKIPRTQFDSVSQDYEKALLASQDDYTSVIDKIRESISSAPAAPEQPHSQSPNIPDSQENAPTEKIPVSSDIERVLNPNPSAERLSFAEKKIVVKPVVTSLDEENITRDALVASYWNDKPRKKAKKKLPFKKIFIAALVVIGTAWFVKVYGLSVKNEILKDGDSAVKSLEAAEGNLKSFDFREASINFTKAYEDFAHASSNLDFFGSSFSSLISNLPGAGALKSARSLVELGQSIARSGQAMSDAVAYLSEAGSILNPTNNTTSNARIIEALSNALFISQKNIAKADSLLADIDVEDIPEEKRTDFLKLSEQLPAIKDAVDSAADYSDFIEKLVAVGGRKKYILLFQNNSELRPTGGFPGTYGIVTFEDGNLTEFHVDDIYNFDGQIKKNIIPPKQMQHITPTWGMRDANWFVDFPTSAKKIMQFYTEISGDKVDGVITAGPDVIVPILKAVGPIEMTDYKLTITADNFLSEIQEEVEYGPNRKQPKQIVKDLAPQVLHRIYSSDSDTWMNIFSGLVGALERKDIMMYFNDLTLRSFALEKGFAGQVHDSNSDFLAVNFSNIKGSKTDEYTDSSVKVSTILKEGMAVHKLTITREHNGGETKYGFYNRPNPAYVRVLVPENTQLIEIVGNDDPDYKPLINYAKSDFVQDEDLKKFESTFSYDPATGVSLFSESGKKGFGFWMITDPGKEKVVELRYSVPLDESVYSLYVQKQPGIVLKKFEFTMKQPDGKTTTSFSPLFNKVGNVFEHSSHLEKDVILHASFE